MNFRAFIRRGSEVFRRWRNEARLGGNISGVPFRWDGRDYVSGDPLSAESVSAIKDHDMVQLVLTTAPAGHVKAVREEPPEDANPKATQTISQQLAESSKPNKTTLTLPQRPAAKK